MPRRRRVNKHRNSRQITRRYLDERKEFLKHAQCPIPDWMIFCEHFVDRGYHVAVRTASNSQSRYITITYGGRQYKVRFSDHPETHHGAFERTDFFVGAPPTVGPQRERTTTEDAIHATARFFGDIIPW